MVDNLNNLTAAQQVFAVFYAIFFGIMLQTIGARRTKAKKEKKKFQSDVTLNLFDTPNAWGIGLRYDNKPFWRFLLSTLFLNVLPGFVFAIIFNKLHGFSGMLNEFQIVLIIWISLAPHYIYRAYMAILVQFKDSLYLSKKEHPDYNKHDLYAYELLVADRSQYKAHSSFFNHFAFPFFFVLPSIVIFYDVLLPNQAYREIIYGSWIFIGFGTLCFILPRNLK